MPLSRILLYSLDKYLNQVYVVSSLLWFLLLDPIHFIGSAQNNFINSALCDYRMPIKLVSL